MKYILIIAMLFTCGFTFSQDEVRDLSNYSSLSVSGGIAVDLKQGDPRAEITIMKGDLEHLKTEMKGDRLKIYFDSNKWGRNTGNNKAKLTLYYKSLDDISVSAGARLECDELLTSDDFEADASSGARLELNIEAGSVDSDVSSGASIEISGKTKSLDVDVSSGGSFRGAGLKAKKVDADASSGGSAKVWVTYSINADASSGGSVRYKGEPEKKDLDPGKWSGGQISKI